MYFINYLYCNFNTHHNTMLIIICKSVFNSFFNFRFPLKNETLLGAWCKAIARKDYAPTANCRICSGHFKDNDYLHPDKSGILKKLAVPSLFDAFPSYMKVCLPCDILTDMLFQFVLLMNIL